MKQLSTDKSMTTSKFGIEVDMYHIAILMMHMDNNNKGDMSKMEQYLIDVFDSRDIQKLDFLVCLTAPEPSNRIKAPAALKVDT
jgi:hypothetical protein